MLRDPNFYLTILGLILGVVGIYLTVRRRYPGRLTYIREAAVSVFNDVVRSIPELAVTYEGAPLAANVVILRGHVVNTGRKDITSEMVDAPVTFQLPEGFRWRKVVITGASSGVKPQCSLTTARQLTFSLGLFRCKEHLSFEAIAEVPIGDDDGKSPAARLDGAVAITHRIADTLKVETRTLPADSAQKRLWSRPGMSQFLLYVALFAILVPVLNHFSDKPAKYEYEIMRNGHTFKANVYPKADGMVKIVNLESNNTEIVAAEQFFADRSWTAKAVPLKKKWWSYIGSATILVLSGLLALNDLWEHRSARRLQKLIRS